MTNEQVEHLMKASHVAISKFLERCVVPLISDHEGAHGVYGCGTLFRRDNEHFLVTARHVFDQVPGGQFGVPIESLKSSEIWTVPATRVATSREDWEDVAVLHIQPGEWLERVHKAGYRTFLTDENVGTDSGSDVFVAYGYPSVDSREKDGALHGKPTLVSARRYEGRTDDVTNVTIRWYDLLLEWQHDIDLRGISGSPIWAVLQADSGIWVPEKSMRLVGVETGVVDKTWIRGTRWAVVASQIESLIPPAPTEPIGTGEEGRQET